jgi:hypothetical protein
MIFRKEQAELQDDLRIEGAAHLQALRFALQVYNEEVIGVEATLPRVINNQKLKTAATHLLWAAPTRRNETRRDISALRRHLKTELTRTYDGELETPHYEFRGQDLGLALGSLANVATTDRDSYVPEQVVNYDVAVRLAEITLAASANNDEISLVA